MDDSYNLDDPQAWVGKTAWRDEVGHLPTSRVPALTKGTWHDRFPDDYPDGRSPTVYCLPRDQSTSIDSRSTVEVRVESLERWRRELQATLGELGRGLRDQAEEARVSDQAMSALLKVLEKRTDQRAHLADRLIAFAMDDPTDS